MIGIAAGDGLAKAPEPLEPLEVTEGIEWTEVPHAYRGGAMTVLGDGRILMVFTRPGDLQLPPGSCKLYTITSRDGGKTWQDEGLMVRADGVPLIEDTTPYSAGRPSLLRMRDGRIGMFYFGFVKSREKCDLWAVWSADDGKTWTEPQLLFDKGYHPGPRGAVELDSGRIVLVFHYTSMEKGRNVCASLTSDDGGKTWTLSPSIDVGKGIDHAGAMEPTVLRLRNGELWMIIRTHHGAYWESFSKDDGLSWSPPAPTSIEIPQQMGGSPCAVMRLASGRLVMVWNPRIKGKPDQGSAWYKLGRGQLGVALSEDDGKTWTKPFIIARGAMLSYPHIVEPSPGRLVVSTGLTRTNHEGKRMKTDTLVFRLTEQSVLDHTRLGP